MEKKCTVTLPLEVNHEIKDIQKEIERTRGTAPTIAALIVELLQEALEARKVKQTV